ncbi:alpha/beta fold hydrolase [Thioclava sp. FR2]|uniref:alpha/beta fold hydrolase n=1 Tax=Thioclava sp. FR2 TaxID=3445780 RepID=UPI003EC02266
MTPDLSAIAPIRQWDRGGERPVLALHCSLAHAGAWSALAALLQGVTITAFDQPGHGRAPDWDGVQEIHGLTTGIAISLAEAIGGGKPIDLLGHSFGGTVALRIALERPDLVRSLVLVEPVIFAAARASGHPAFAPFHEGHMAFIRLLNEGKREEAAALFHASWGGGEALSELSERQRRYIIDRIHHIAAQNPVLLQDAAGLLAFMRLESLGVPVLLVEGGASPPIIDAIMEELDRRIPQAQRLVVPGAGHMVPITHAKAVAPTVQAHWAAC